MGNNTFEHAEFKSEKFPLLHALQGQMKCLPEVFNFERTPALASVPNPQVAHRFSVL